jgi:rod shape-determining protein MreC
MKKVSKSAAVTIGDTVVTSTYSANFPSNILIGTVAEIKPEPSSSFNNIKVKVATNFFSLQYVYLVENIHYVEQTTLANKKDNKE